MRVDGFFVVGRETSGGAVVFMQTYYTSGGLPMRHWGELKFADRYLMLEGAKKAAENAPRQYEGDEPATVWRVEVNATKMEVKDDGDSERLD